MCKYIYTSVHMHIYVRHKYTYIHIGYNNTCIHIIYIQYIHIYTYMKQKGKTKLTQHRGLVTAVQGAMTDPRSFVTAMMSSRDELWGLKILSHRREEKERKREELSQAWGEREREREQGRDQALTSNYGCDKLWVKKNKDWSRLWRKRRRRKLNMQGGDHGRDWCFRLHHSCEEKQRGGKTKAENRSRPWQVEFLP